MVSGIVSVCRMTTATHTQKEKRKMKQDTGQKKLNTTEIQGREKAQTNR